MTSKLKCPVCNHELHQTASECLTYCCLNKDCPSDFKFAGSKEIWQALIQAKRDLKIARKALEEIKKVCDGCRWCDSNLYDPTPNDGRRIAETTNNALTQIEHKEK